MMGFFKRRKRRRETERIRQENMDVMPEGLLEDAKGDSKKVVCPAAGPCKAC